MKDASAYDFIPVSLPIMDQCQEIHHGTSSPWVGVRVAQTFTVGISGLLRLAELNLEVHGGVGVARLIVMDTHEWRPNNVICRTSAIPVCTGWNAFDLSSMRIAMTAGRQYAIQLDPLSACDWRVWLGEGGYEGGALWEQWADAPWEASTYAATATFRTYVDQFRSASSPSWGSL